MQIAFLFLKATTFDNSSFIASYLSQSLYAISKVKKNKTMEKRRKKLKRFNENINSLKKLQAFFECRMTLFLKIGVNLSFSVGSYSKYFQNNDTLIFSKY